MWQSLISKGEWQGELKKIKRKMGTHTGFINALLLAYP